VDSAIFYAQAIFSFGKYANSTGNVKYLSHKLDYFKCVLFGFLLLF